MLIDLLTQDIALVRREVAPTKDEFGDEVLEDQAVVVVRGLLQSRTTAEDPIDNARNRMDAVVYLEGSVTLEGADAVEVDGVTWEIDGDPEYVYNPRTRVVHHTRLGVMRAYG